MLSDLQISELRYRRLFETAQDGILLIDFKNGMIIDVNKFLIDLLGYSKKDFLKKYLWEIGVFKDITASKKNFKTLQKKRYVRFENLPLETKAGKKIHVEFVANAYSVGSQIFIQCNVRDISDRVKAEDALKNSEILFRELFENMSSGVAIYEVKNNGRDFIFKDFNKASEILEKIKKEKIIGKNVVKVFPDVKKFGLYRILQKVWRTGKSERHPLSFYKDKRVFGWRENFVYKLPNGNIVAIYDDVTQHKEAEEKIKWLATYPILNPRPIVEIDKKDRVVFINPAAQKLFPDLKNKQLNHLFVKGSLKYFSKLNLTNKTSDEREIEINGHWYLQTFYLVNQNRLRIYANDITNLKETEEKFSKAFHISSFSTTITRLDDGSFIDVNEAFSFIFGFSKEEALASSSIKLNLWLDIKDRKRIVSDLLAGRQIYNLEFKFRKKNGEIFTALFSAQIIKLSGIDCILSSIVDITDRKRAEEKIVELNNRNESILESIGDAVFACDKNGTILLFNKLASELTGFSKEEAIGKHYKILNFIKEIDNSKIDIVCKSLQEDKIIKTNNHILLISKDGIKISISHSSAPIKNFKGESVGCVVVLHDMTKEYQIDKAKTEFISLASHQMRTPLTAINWYLEILRSYKYGSLNSKQTEFTLEIENASKRMTLLIDSLLNISRLEMGTFTVQPVHLNLTNLIKNIIELLISKIGKKNLVIEQKYDTDVSHFFADPNLLGIIFQNLFSNAVKYTPKGGKIRLIVKKENNLLKIILSDNGIGIPSNQQDKIFEKFFRGDNVRMIDPNGSGLGLYIVREIVNSSGGRIWFESKENYGTTFYITYPITGMTKKGRTKKIV